MKQEIKERIEKIRNGEVPEGYQKTKVGIIPVEWDIVPTNKVLKTVKKPVNVEPNTEYREIGIRSHGKGIFHKKLVQGKKLGNKRVFWVEDKCFIVNIVFAWEQAVAITSENERGLIASHRFPMYKPKNNLIYLDYLLTFYQSLRGKFQLNLASPGGAGRNKTLGQKKFSQSLIPLPTIYEQIKIVDILSTWDRAIVLKEKLIEMRKEFKKGLMQKLLTGEIRFFGFNDEWNENKIIDIINYEQPNRFITKNIVDLDKALTPVLTANKSFILGSTFDDNGIYTETPVIIFDDFTINNKYVDFPFKVRSSAIKILKPKSNSINIKFVYELMQIIKFPLGDHKRYYISEYQYVKIKIPKHIEQERIVKVSNNLDSDLTILNKELNQLKEQKKGLTQLLLTGIVRVEVD